MYKGYPIDDIIDTIGRSHEAPAKNDHHRHHHHGDESFGEDHKSVLL